MNKLANECSIQTRSKGQPKSPSMAACKTLASRLFLSYKAVSTPRRHARILQYIVHDLPIQSIVIPKISDREIDTGVFKQLDYMFVSHAGCLLESILALVILGRQVRFKLDKQLHDILVPSFRCSV